MDCVGVNVRSLALPPVVPRDPALPARGCPEGAPGGAAENQNCPHAGAGGEVAAESQVSARELKEWKNVQSIILWEAYIISGVHAFLIIVILSVCAAIHVCACHSY